VAFRKFGDASDLGRVPVEILDSPPAESDRVQVDGSRGEFLRALFASDNPMTQKIRASMSGADLEDLRAELAAYEAEQSK